MIISNRDEYMLIRNFEPNGDLSRYGHCFISDLTSEVYGGQPSTTYLIKYIFKQPTKRNMNERFDIIVTVRCIILSRSVWLFILKKKKKSTMYIAISECNRIVFDMQLFLWDSLIYPNYYLPLSKWVHNCKMLKWATPGCVPKLVLGSTQLKRMKKLGIRRDQSFTSTQKSVRHIKDRHNGV